MQYVDTTNLHVRQARRVTLPEWAAPVIESEGGPLLFAGRQGGRQIAVLAFDLHDSDLPLQIAFPILLANLMQWYAPASMFDVSAGLAPDQPIAIRPPAGATQIEIQRPDGSTVSLPASESGVASVEPSSTTITS